MRNVHICLGNECTNNCESVLNDYYSKLIGAMKYRSEDYKFAATSKRKFNSVRKRMWDK